MKHSEEQTNGAVAAELQELDDSLRLLAQRALEAPSAQLPSGFAKQVSRAALGSRATPAPAAKVVSLGFGRQSMRLVAAAAALAFVATAALLYLRAPKVVGMVAYEEGSGAPKGREVLTGQRFEAGAALTAWLDSSRIHLMLNEGASLDVLGREDVALHSGEAWFHVTPGSGRFAVTTPHGTVSVVGTAFGVAVGEHGSSVTVTRGKVRAEFGGREQFVSAGESWSSAGLTAGADAPGWATSLLEKESQERLQLFFPSAAPVGEDGVE